MTQTPYTSGPWALDDKTGSITWGNCSFGAPIGAGSFVVGSHSISRIASHQPERLTETHKANSRLIAAAPDLHAVLVDLMISGCVIDALEQTGGADIVARANAALAKVRGEAVQS